MTGGETEKGLVSFIIPAYRDFSGIYATLQSAFDQDWPRIEVIISDDGSPNWEEELPRIRDYAEEHRGANIERVVYHHLPENQGTVRNANSAYRLARGEYIKDLSPDDVLACPDALSRYVRFLEDGGWMICFSRLQGIDDDGNLVRHLASSADDYGPYREMEPLQVRDQLFRRNCLPAPAWFARRELFLRYGYYPETARLIEDYPYWIHLCTEGVRIGFMDDVLVNYRLSGMSGAGEYGEQFMKDLCAIYDEWIFPYDRRYGRLQPVYNMLKRAGLNAYMDKARWKGYSAGQKAAAWVKHGAFFAYISWGNYRMRRKNRA